MGTFMKDSESSPSIRQLKMALIVYYVKVIVVLPLENEQECEENPFLRCRFRGNT